MKRFTDSPYEKMMMQTPRAHCPDTPKAPPGSPCYRCSYWCGMACVGICYKELTATRKGGRGTSGQFVLKSSPV